MNNESPLLSFQATRTAADIAATFPPSFVNSRQDNSPTFLVTDASMPLNIEMFNNTVGVAVGTPRPLGKRSIAISVSVYLMKMDAECLQQDPRWGQ